MKPVLILVLLLVMPAMTSHAREPAPDSQLCRSQLKLLLSGDKLTDDEAQRFETQCDCLEAREQGKDGSMPDTCAP